MGWEDGTTQRSDRDRQTHARLRIVDEDHAIELCHLEEEEERVGEQKTRLDERCAVEEHNACCKDSGRPRAVHFSHEHKHERHEETARNRGQRA